MLSPSFLLFGVLFFLGAGSRGEARRETARIDVERRGAARNCAERRGAARNCAERRGAARSDVERRRAARAMTNVNFLFSGTDLKTSPGK